MKDNEILITVRQHDMMPTIDTDEYSRAAAGCYAIGAARELGQVGDIDVQSVSVQFGGDVDKYYLEYLGLTGLGTHGLLVKSNIVPGDLFDDFQAILISTDVHGNGYAVHPWHAMTRGAVSDDQGLDLFTAVTGAILQHRNLRLPAKS